MNILFDTLNTIKPSVRRSDLLQYQELQKILNETDLDEDKPGKKPFGFTISDDNGDKE